MPDHAKQRLSPPQLRAPALAAGALVLALAGCGSSGSSYNSSPSTPSSSGKTKSTAAATSSTSGAKVPLKADPDGSLYFEPKALKAKAGTVTLVMTNPSSTGKQHGIAVEGNGVDKDGPVVSAGQSPTLTVKLKPGQYEVYCPFHG